MVLRIEDLDVQRSHREYADQAMRDFEMLGLDWDEGPYYQQDRTDAYSDAFHTLENLGVVYPCFCTRADLHAASAPHVGERTIYAGTCRNLSPLEIAQKQESRNPAFRLAVPHETISFDDIVQGRFSQQLDRDCGDFIIRRSDGLFAYQLAVVVDDAHQGVNCIVRGTDLLSSTPQQIHLQNMLGLERCRYAHVPLMVAKSGRRLSKRDHDAGIDEMLDRFGSPQGIIGHIAHLAGLIDRDEAAAPRDLLDVFSLEELPRVFPDKAKIPWDASL